MTAKRQIAFIDPSLVDWKTLLAGLNEDIEVVILDPSTNGLLQIAESLRGTNSVSAIHIFSHGSSGEITLGGMALNAGNLVDYGDALVTIGNALTGTGDILLYGCNVAQGDGGQAFIAQLAAATGADVAASTDLTGNTALGGDWVLEAASGAVEASGLNAASFAGLLDLTTSPLNYSYPSHSGGEYRNIGAFAALRADGSVVTWGNSSYGGVSSGVATALDGTIDVTQIFCNYSAFAALRADGSVVTWGTTYGANSGGNSSAVATQLNGAIDVTQVFSTGGAFAALRADGSVVTWSDYAGGSSSTVAASLDGTIDVTRVFSNFSAFAALRADGSVVTWGANGDGGDSSVVTAALGGTIDVTQVFSTESAFAALRADGSVVTWGHSTYGGDSSSVVTALNGTIDVTQVFATKQAFAALRADGSVVTWGTNGGDSSSVAMALNGTIDVTQVFSSEQAFAALRADGSVVTWGHPSYGGDSSSVAMALNGTIDVTQVFSTGSAFAALRADGSVVTWGSASYGGDSSAVASQINGSIDVTQVFSTDSAFAALRADGSLVTWGDLSYGGDSSAVASQLDGTINVTHVFSTGSAFAALRADGSLVTWGYASTGGNSSAVASQINGTIDVVWMADPFHNDVYIASGPGDTVREGTDTTTVLAVGGTVSGVIDAEPISGDGVTSDGAGGYVDKDWYQVTLTAGHSYHFAATAGVSGSDTLDAVSISLKDALGATIESLAEGASPGLDFTPASNGTYYLAISAGGDGAWQTKTGDYQVSLADNGVAPADDFAGSTATTGTVSVGGSKAGNIETADDTDWFKVTLTAGHAYRFDVLGADSGNGTLADPVMELRDSTGEAFFSDDDSGTGFDAQIAYTPTADGTYFVSVGSYSDGHTSAGIGSYKVSIIDNSVSDAGKTADKIFLAHGGLNVGKVGILANFSKAAYALGDWEKMGENVLINDLADSGGDDRDATHVSAELFGVNEWRPLTLSMDASKLPLQIYMKQEVAAKGILGSDLDVATYWSTTNQAPNGYTPGSLDVWNVNFNWYVYANITNKYEGGLYTKGSSAALVAVCDNALVIAFRGSNDNRSSDDDSGTKNAWDPNNWFRPDVGDWNAMADHYANLQPLIDALDAYASDPFNHIDHVYVTGHSLGGAMALRYMNDHDDTASRSYEAITFAAPAYYDSPFHQHDDRITCIEIQDDPVPRLVGQNPQGDILYFIGDQTLKGDNSNHTMEYYRDLAWDVDDATWGSLLAQNGETEILLGGSRSVSNRVEDFVVATGDDTLRVTVIEQKLDDELLFNRDIDIIYGGAGKDVLTGDGSSEWLVGGTGDDHLDGGAGLDTALFSGSKAGYTLTRTSSGMTAASAADGTDALINIERLQFTDKSLAFDLDGNAGQVYRLYQAAFDRVPDQGGLGYWINEIDRGTGLSQVATGFINSAEFKALYGNNPSNAEFVTLIYDNVLHRTPDAGGYSYWMEQLSSGMTKENVLIGFSESTENKVALMAFSMDGNMGKDYRLYQAAFDRKPDVSGLDYWYHQMNSGVTLQQVASGFINSAEFKALYGNNPSNAELVTLLYDNVLHRAPDTGGFNYWINELDHGTSREQVLIGFSESLENQLSLVGIVQTGIEFV